MSGNADDSRHLLRAILDHCTACSHALLQTQSPPGQVRHRAYEAVARAVRDLLEETEV